MMQKIDERWFAGLPSEDREKFKQEVINSKKVLDKLGKILYNIEESLRTVKERDYDSPSWSHKQAHRNGESDMVRRVIELITIVERDDHPTI